MKRFYYNSVITLKRFLKHNKGAIIIEMAFVLPIMIMLIMAIFEYSIIFALRTGINNQLQDVMRTRSTSDVDYSAAPYNVTTPTGASIRNRNARATKALHAGLGAVVFDITQARISTRMANTLAEMRTVAFSTPEEAFSVSEPPDTNTMIQRSSRRYAQIRLEYRHRYITPIGFLTNGTANVPLDMSFMAIYRND